MRILQLMPWSPVPPDFGGALRVFHVLKGLAERHEVTVLTYGDGGDRQRLLEAIPSVKEVHVVPRPWTEQIRRLGQLYASVTRHSFYHLSVVSPAMQGALDRLLARGRFDVVQTEFSHMGPFRLDTDALKLVDAHNVEYDNFRRMWLNTAQPVRKLHYYLEYRKSFREEIAWCRQQDALLTTSERDKELFERDVPGVPKYVVPNGVDAGYFTPSELSPEPASLVFTGMMAYVPNYDGVLWFLDEIFPRVLARRPEAKLYVVGKSPPKQLLDRASERVVVTGTVDDVRPYVHRGKVYVVPLRMGGGTRLKILEALAMKKPIVTTRVGCEGIDVVDGESALLADEPQAFADAVLRLLDDDALARKLTRNGHALMRERFEWSVIGKELDAVYQRLAERRGRAGAAPARAAGQ